MDDPKEPSSSLVHPPLPYMARVRVVADDDSVPQVREVHVVAYSVIEAAMQAITEVGGTSVLSDEKYRVESIGPDLAAYARLFGNVLSSALLKKAGK